MPIELTRQSAVEYDNIVSGKMTPAMAAEYLRNGRVTVRSFADTLREMYSAPDLIPRMTDFFQTASPDANPQSVSRKIRNWLTGRHQPADREDVFKTAFALGLGEEQLNSLLKLCTDYGIQYRNDREVIFTWFLRNGRSYPEAERFFASLPSPRERNVARTRRTSQLTHEMQAQFQMAHTLEELRSCHARNLDNFGTMHLRAYHYFEQYLRQLIRPTPYWDSSAAEPDYSLETVMETYLSLRIPSGRKRTDYTLVQKLLKQNWPNATSIKNIRNHKEDVSRKLLLLLYVVTENEAAEPGLYNELDEDYTSLEDRVEYHWWTLNAILNDCGMASLDPRNATDWLILYAISSDPEEPMSDRLEQVISHVFVPAEED